MTTKEIKLELQNKVKEIEWTVKVSSLEMITWMNDLIKRIDAVEKKPEVKKVVEVEVPEEKPVEEPTEEVVEEEKKPVPKRKIVFKKK